MKHFNNPVTQHERNRKDKENNYPFRRNKFVIKEMDNR